MGLFNKLFGSKSKKEEKDAQTLKFDALRALNMGQIPFALQLLKKSLELKDEFETRFYYAQTLNLLKDYSTALEQENLLLQEETQHLPTLLMRGQTLFYLKELDKALNDFIKAQEEDKDEDYKEEIFYWLAVIYFEKGNFEEALAYAEKGINTESPEIRFFLQKSKNLLALKRYSEAKEFLTQASEIFDEEEQFHLFQAEIAKEEGNFEEQKQALDLALEKNPFSEECYCQIAQMHYQIEGIDKAIASLETAIEEEITGLKIYTLLLQLYKKGNYTEKREKLEQKMQEMLSNDGKHRIDFEQMYHQNNPFY